ncbi:MAG: hypothetical protein CUN56_00150 [Phototrophicales bacterium]|nr:MAG: hypothetical protein CUN56_00150 [Phototrophicales bacterium]
MATITYTAADVDAAPNATVVRGKLGEAATTGDALYLNSDGRFYKADSAAAATAKARGILVGGQQGTSYPAGMDVDVCVYGRVLGYSGMTPGGSVFVTSAGALDQTAPAAVGTFTWELGWAFSPTVVFVAPQNNEPTAN